MITCKDHLKINEFHFSQAQIEKVHISFIYVHFSQSLTTYLGTFWNELKTSHTNEVNCDFNCVENKAKNEDFGS